MSIFKILSYVGPLSVIIPAIVGSIKVKSFSPALKLLVFYLIIASIKEPLCLYLAHYKIPNLSIYNWTGTFEYILLIGIYYYSFKSKKYKKIALFLSIAYFIFSLVNILLVQGDDTFNSYTSTFGNISMTLLVLLFFYELLEKPEVINLSRVPLFWISVGLLLFSIGTFFLHGLFALHTSLPNEVGKNIWQINSVLYLTQNILFTIAFLCQTKITK